MSETKYQNFEIMIMDTKILKEELIKELKKKRPDETYIEEILTYGAWGDEIEWFNKETTTIEKAFKLVCDNENMILSFLAKKGYLSLIKLLLKDSNVDPNTIIHEASSWGHSHVVEALLSHPKTNPNLKGSCGRTALIEASTQGHSQVVEELLKHPNIDPNLKDSKGRTALQVALRQGHSQVVEELLKHPKIKK